MAVQMIEHPSAANPITSLWSLSIVALDAVVVVLLIAAHVFGWASRGCRTRPSTYEGHDLADCFGSCAELFAPTWRVK
jgi:hypothetical protein